MLIDILTEFLGPCPQGLEFMYIIMGFALLLIGLIFVFLILNAFFKIVRRGR